MVFDIKRGNIFLKLESLSMWKYCKNLIMFYTQILVIFLHYIINFYAEFHQVVIKFVNVGKSNEVFSEKEISSHHHESFVLTENWQCIGIKRRVGGGGVYKN